MKICLKNEDDTSVSTHYLQHDQIQKHPHIFATTNEIWKAAFLKKYKKNTWNRIFSGCCVNPRLQQESSEPAAETTSSHARTATAAKTTPPAPAAIPHLCEREKT